jgi:hypothetical protein
MGSNDPEMLTLGEQTGLRELGPCRPLPANHVETTAKTPDQGFTNLCHLNRPWHIRLADDEDSQGLSYINGSLRALSTLYHSHPNMETLLQTGSRLVVDILDLEHCSIGWLCDNACGIEVWTGHTREGAEVDPRRLLQAFAGLVNRLPPRCNHRSGDPVPCAESACELWRQREIVSPLRIDNQIVGYICGLKSAGAEAWLSDTEKSIFIALSRHISAAIEAQRTREMLDSPYIALALTPREREGLAGLSALERPFLEPINDPERLVRKIARRFCADLHRSGFEIKHILCVATELLDSLLVVQQASKPRSSQSSR